MTRSAVTSRAAAAALFGFVLLGFLTETKFAVAFTIGRTITTPFQSVHSSLVGNRRLATRSCRSTQARIALHARTTLVEERERLDLAKKTTTDKDAIKFYDAEEKHMTFVERSPEEQEKHADEQSLFEILYIMLNVSNLMYTFAAIRSIIRGQVILYEESRAPWPFRRWSRKAVPPSDLQSPQLVYTQDFQGEDRRLPQQEGPDDTFIKREITVNDLATFIQENFDLFEKAPIEEINTQEGDAMNILDILEQAKRLENAYLFEFDDQFADTQLVYAILVNHDDKRITVTFRGSVGGEDWSTNLDAKLVELEPPQPLKDLGFDEEIKVHNGFKTYLFGETAAGDGTEKKYDRILKNLEDVFQENPDYKLFIAGHSLGGALASLLGFEIAASNDLPNIRRPINIVSFGSPNVGPKSFNDAYQVLEKNEKLRYLRVSNQGDLVSVLPPFPNKATQLNKRYTPNGVNIHLGRKQDPMQIAYRNLKNLWTERSFNPGANHGLNVYLRRILRQHNRSILQARTFDVFFEDADLVEGLADRSA